LFFRAPWHEWEKAGMKYIHARARERAREILKSHQAPPLDRDIREEMRRVVKGADTQTQKITL
jgi:trimethylamine:corrinoid methyltransferase-like protein